MGLLATRSNRVLGVDISSTAIKLLELDQKGGQLHAKSFGAAALPANSINDKQIVDVEKVGIAIAKALKKSESKLKNAAIAVAGSTVINKVIRMPANLDDFSLEQQVTLEADQHVPYSMDEIYLDFEVLGLSDNEIGSVDVLLTASKKENIDAHIAALEIAGLATKIVDVEAFSLENACSLLRRQMPERGNGKTVAVVDAGASSTSLTVLHNNAAVYHREQMFGGKQLTEAIMEKYQLNFEDAGRVKRSGGEFLSDYQEFVAQPFVTEMAQVVNRSIQLFFAASPKFSQVDSIILAGGCAMVDGVCEAVSQNTGVTTVKAAPFSEIRFSDSATKAGIESDTAALLTAAGLALRSFDERHN